MASELGLVICRTTTSEQILRQQGRQRAPHDLVHATFPCLFFPDLRFVVGPARKREEKQAGQTCSLLEFDWLYQHGLKDA